MASDMLDVRRAAALVGRHPETVRRWIWSGRLPARREANRLLVARSDLEAVAGRGPVPALSLSEWIARVDADRDPRARGSGRSAADLILEDRAARSR